MLEILAASALALAADPCAPSAGRPACGEPLKTACAKISDIPDPCGTVAEAAALLGPTYDAQKRDPDRRTMSAARRRLKDLGFVSDYIAAKGGGWFGDTTDVFLATRPGSQRLYVVVTGTESVRDWYENAKAKAYTTRYVDGYFYTPPAHAGFRSGMLNLIAATLKHDEFDREKLTCRERKPSRLAKFLCRDEGRFDYVRPIEVVLVGHSRGAGIALLSAPALAGLEFRTLADGSMTVLPQANWPLQLAGVIGFATPAALYHKTDRAAGIKVPPGVSDQWQVYTDARIDKKTVNLFNERDLVPNLSLGLSDVVGHRFRVADVPGRVEYAGFGSANSISLITAHKSAGYCRDVRLALSTATSVCDPLD